MTKYVLRFCLFMFSVAAFAQEAGEKEKLRIQEIYQALSEKENKAFFAITNFDAPTEYWFSTDLSAEIQSLRITYYQNPHHYEEYYITENGKLIYAFESQVFVPYNHELQQMWNCAYYLNDQKVFDYISLGHGKTEEDDWDPQEIVTQFQRRNAQKTMIKEVYQP